MRGAGAWSLWQTSKCSAAKFHQHPGVLTLNSEWLMTEQKVIPSLSWLGCVMSPMSALQLGCYFGWCWKISGGSGLAVVRGLLGCVPKSPFLYRSSCFVCPISHEVNAKCQDVLPKHMGPSDLELKQIVPSFLWGHFGHWFADVGNTLTILDVGHPRARCGQNWFFWRPVPGLQMPTSPCPHVILPKSVPWASL